MNNRQRRVPLLIATTNRAKLNEYRLLLANLPFELLSLGDLQITQTPEENGATFSENALIKARFYRKLSGLPTLADDGGLEVDALGGEPGVRSHRWIDGREASDEELIAEVLRRMRDVDDGRRTARIKAALALAYVKAGVEREAVVEDALEGVIGRSAYPNYPPGFPYRALLYLPKMGRFFAELSDEEAAQLSQRKAALERARPYLMEILESA